MAVTKLRQLLLADGRAQYKIANSAGVNPGRLSEYALGTRSMPTNVIYLLIRELNCNVDDLLGWEEEYVEAQDFDARGRPQTSPQDAL